MHRQNHRWTDDTFGRTKRERQVTKISWWVQPTDAQFKTAQQKRFEPIQSTSAVMKHREGT